MAQWNKDKAVYNAAKGTSPEASKYMLGRSTYNFSFYYVL
jgi:hypothetical protein